MKFVNNDYSMTFKELLNKFDLKIIQKAFFKSFPEVKKQSESYANAISELYNANSILSDKNLGIFVSEDDEYEIEVYGVDLTSNSKFPLDNTSWYKILGYKVSTEEIDEIDLICEVIREITFYGTDIK